MSEQQESPAEAMVREARVIAGLPLPAKCERCGCTETTPCEGGCSWDQMAYREGRWVCTACAGNNIFDLQEMESPPMIPFREDGRLRALILTPDGYEPIDIDTTFGELAIGARFTSRSGGPSWVKLDDSFGAVIGNQVSRQPFLAEFPVRLEVC